MRSRSRMIIKRGGGGQNLQFPSLLLELSTLPKYQILTLDKTNGLRAEEKELEHIGGYDGGGGSRLWLDPQHTW